MIAKQRFAKPISSFASEAARWHAVLDRDAAAEDSFVYAVRTTGVYCRCTCPARRPLRKNVLFFDDREAAAAAGFRPCARCRPDSVSPAKRKADIVARACRHIESADRRPTLADLANEAGFSTFHFQRLFQLQTGVTPKQYAAAVRGSRTREALAGADKVTSAIYAAGYESSGRFYERAAQMLGMTPTEFRAGGQHVSIRFAVGQCWLGAILVAATEKGICAISLGSDADVLVRELQDRFQSAKLCGDDPAFAMLIARVVGFVADPARGLDLPLDIRGTAFQQQVWEALRKIPAGSTLTYAELAQRLGKPQSVRAVASACAANVLAVAIPCHRVIRTDGSLSGYRWGIERKQALLARERRG
jgi:AraC family transcriptional regulator of adaptative response/methylated-DNA-[protein]-cysteine methyltransferase